ncbi:MAG: flagellar biosynthetic protein FliO [Halanaerobiales bacterium]|nr:flagellar biosynthetic protein FliO [Halanaerobiales bacterium]
MNYTFEILKIGFYLILIVGVIYFLAMFIKKNITKVQSGSHLKVIDRIYMGTKIGLLLVEVNDEIILISQTENSIEKLDKWNKDDFDIDFDQIDNNSSDNTEKFKEIFMQYLGRNDSDSE